MTIDQLHSIHVEWHTRLCRISDTALPRYFRRYFERFEGRIKEPSFAVFDDLTYTQESKVERKLEALISPKIEQRRELFKYGVDLAKEDTTRTTSTPTIAPALSPEFGDLYGFPETTDWPTIASHSATVEDSVSSERPFDHTHNESSFTLLGPQNRSSPLRLGAIITASPWRSLVSTSGRDRDREEMAELTFEEGEGVLSIDAVNNGIEYVSSFIDQGVLEFPDTSME